MIWDIHIFTISIPIVVFPEPAQRVLNRWSKLLEQKLRFLSKVKIKKKMLLIKNDGHIRFILDKKKS